MQKNSLWFPRFSSWLSGLLLLLLTGGLTSSMERIFDALASLMDAFPRLFFFGVAFAIVSPIGIIAYVHHLIQLILDKLDPDGAGGKTSKGFGLFWPNIFSWWEGTYGWLVILLATILTIGLLGLSLPWKDPDQIWDHIQKLYEMLVDVNKFKYIFSPVTVIWVIISAYLYQFEHVVMLRQQRRD